MQVRNAQNYSSEQANQGMTRRLVGAEEKRDEQLANMHPVGVPTDVRRGMRRESLCDD
jgi:hypothetical protein